MRIYLTALGCRLNEAELESWSTDFTEQGHLLASKPEQADLVVINTCAVTQEAEKKSRQLIHRARRRNPQAKLVISGCYSSLHPELTSAMPDIDLLVANRDKDRLVEIVMRRFSLMARPSMVPVETPLFQRGRQRAFIKIQDGCRYRCTYCVTTLARGQERSRTIDQILAEVNSLVAQGIKEAVLTGVQVGGYGNDINQNLYQLIDALLKETDLPRLRLASVEPWALSDKFFTLFENPRLMPHIHLPLQSGSDRVLKRMARRCRTADFKKLVDFARNAVPDFNITTDIIVGFPSETAKEWQTSLDFITQIGFSHIHIFSYSMRTGTKAAGLPAQLQQADKKKRSAELQQLAAKMKLAWLQKHINRKFPVLWESKKRVEGTGTARYYGYTPNFMRVQIDSNALLTNEIRMTRLKTVSSDSQNLVGELIV